MSKKTTVVEFDLSPTNAKRMLIETARDSGRIFFVDHAEKRMKQRNITRTQVIRCLTHGVITEGPYRNIKGSWQLRIETLSAGDPLTVIAVLDRDNKGNCVIVITTYK